MTLKTTKDGYEYEMKHSPSFSALILHLKKGQKVMAERGAMMYMHRTINIETKRRKGGLIKGIMTSAFGGEDFFVNTFTAGDDGELGLISPLMGDIIPIHIKNGMVLQSGAYLGSSPEINIDTKWKGLKGFLSEKDVIMLHVSGEGSVWIATFGGIINKNLKEGERVSVDTGHIVAFSDEMDFSVRRVGGWKSSLLSGEGLVSDFTGPGKLLMQTRHLPGFAHKLVPYLPIQNNG